MAAAEASGRPKVRPESAFATIRNLWPYMWPADRPDLKRRVALALAVLVAAKVVTVLVPYAYKWATDALSSARRAAAAAPGRPRRRRSPCRSCWSSPMASAAS